MTIHEVEALLGPPRSINEENGYELWLYKNNNLDIWKI